MPCQILPFREEVRPRLPTIQGNVDYRTVKQRLHQIDALLRQSGVERDFVQRSLNRWAKGSDHEPAAAQQARFQQRSKQSASRQDPAHRA